MIKDAYASNIGRLPRDKTKKLILILKYIHDNIHNRRLVSVENTNNVVSNIPISDKDAIYAACKKVISDYEYQPNSIIDHFYLR